MARNKKEEREIPTPDIIRDVGCEEQEKIWMVVWGSLPQEEQRGLEVSTIFSVGMEGTAPL